MSARFPVDSLTVYEEDDETVLFEVSTDPAHQAPFLKAFDNYPEQEIDFAKGSASIGQQNVRIVDVPTEVLDQATGFVTSKLAEPGEGSQILGHRAVTRQDVGSGPEIVLEGVVKSVQLMDTYSGYELELRDIREREREAKAFQRTTTPTVLPYGVLDGWGIPVPLLATTTVRPIPPTRPLTGTFRSWLLGGGDITFSLEDNPRSALVLTDAMREALSSTAVREGAPDDGVIVFDRIRVLWRDKATGGAYSVLDDIVHTYQLATAVGRSFYRVDGEGIIQLIRVDNLLSGSTLPSNGQEIEVIVQYDGPVTENFPHYIQGITVGELLRNLYRGDYSDRDPRIRYNEAALLALTTPVRAKITEPVDDLRAWTEEHAYPITHAAPALNADGEIAPVTYLLPDATVSVPTLSDSNCRPAGGGWSHGTADAVNLVRLTYHRDLVNAPGVSVEVPVLQLAGASAALIGEQELEISGELLRSIGSTEGPLFGDVTDETGAEVAHRIAAMAIDRLSLGGQYFALEGRRTDADVEALQVGDYVIVGDSWQPDYESGRRGANRLAQVLGRRNIDAAWTSLSLIDAGTAAAPVGQPTLGVVTIDSLNRANVPITAIAAGSEARIDYAVNPTEPPADSSLWRFRQRVAYAPFAVRIHPTPPGSTLWVRARGEAVGRRPSAYTTPVSVTASIIPRVLDVTATVDELAVATVEWTPNQHCAGVRLHYEVHDAGQTPASPSNTIDVDASDGEHEFASLRVPRGKALTVQVEPWTGWTGSAVSGSAGERIEARAVGEIIPGQPWAQADFVRDAQSETAQLTLSVVDFRGSVVSVEFNKREGSQQGDSFGGWSDGWDTAPSAPPFDGTYVEQLAAPGGEESVIRWRVIFEDREGNTWPVGGTHTTAMIDAHETKIVIAGVTFRPEQQSSADNYETQNGYLTNGTDGSDEAHVSSVVPIPAGVLITAVEQEAYVEAGAGQDSVTTKLYAWDSGGSTVVSICNTVTDGWSVFVDDVNHTVDADKWYNFDAVLTLDPADPVAHARLGSVGITYLRHTQQENL